MKRSKSVVLQWLGVFTCIGSTIFGLWMGLYVCLFGGVVDIINGFSADPWIAGLIAWGVLKFLCTGAVGWISFFVGWGLGMFLIAVGEG